MLLFPQNSPHSQSTRLPPIHPPFRLALVECSTHLDSERLYRAAYPTLKNFRYLKRLGLRTLVSLAPKDLVTADLGAFCHAEGIAHLSFPVSGTQRPLDADVNDENSPAPTHILVANVLALCINPERMPVLVHCVDGAHVTGLVIAVLRKLQGWPEVSYVEEFERFTKDHASATDDERRFLSTFSLSVVLPPSLPAWLWTDPTSFVAPPLFREQEEEEDFVLARD